MLKEDNRFKINETTMNYILKQKIKRYKIIKLSLGKIYRVYEGKVYFLEDTDVYKYLKNSTSQKNALKYKKYCQKNKMDNPSRSESEFNLLIEMFEKTDYDVKKGIIIVNQFNVIIDGQHRSCILLDKYGPHYEIEVLKIYYEHFGISSVFFYFFYRFKCILKKGY